MKTHHEVERKYEVGADLPVPPLATLPEVEIIEDPRELELESVYFDTDSRDLMRAGVTLRRRTGGDDDGWHLKLPRGAGEREELTKPLRKGSAATTVPRQLRALVQVHVRGRKVAPVATLRNRRVVQRLLARDGTALAEFCDDHVTATVPEGDGSTTSTSWREWELELVEGSRTLLEAADDLVATAGARPAPAGSKLARALGQPASDHVELTQREPSRRGPAGVVVLAHLREQVDTLKASDPRVRRDLPDSVHKMRVASRRLRSALATFAPLLDTETGEDLRAELKWLAGNLGEARDAEVMRDRLTTMAADDARDAHDTAAADDAEDEAGSGAAGEVHRELEARFRTAHHEVLRVLDSARYFRLLDSLDALVDSPPWTSTAREPARTVLPALVRRDWRRVKKRAVAVEQASTPAEQDLELHELRKAAKRLRYACEGLAPVFGKPAGKLGAAAEDLQEVLGEHQDSVVSQELLRELATASGVSAETGFVLGRLHLLEQGHAERARTRYESAWKQVADKRRRRWLTS